MGGFGERKGMSNYIIILKSKRKKSKRKLLLALPHFFLTFNLTGPRSWEAPRRLGDHPTCVCECASRFPEVTLGEAACPDVGSVSPKARSLYNKMGRREPAAAGVVPLRPSPHDAGPHQSETMDPNHSA